MLEKTLLDAITTYKVYLHMESKNLSKSKIDSIIKLLTPCEEYLNQGNKVNDEWLKSNHSILAKVVKCAYSDAKEASLDDKHEELNKFVVYFKAFYNHVGIDYAEIPVFI